MLVPSRIIFQASLSLTFSPLTTSNDGGNKVLEKRAANVAPRQQFAFDSSVTSVAIFVDIANSTIQKVSNNITRVCVTKLGTDVRLDGSSKAKRYTTEPKRFEYLYERKSECPISSSQNDLASDVTTTLSSSGSAPSLLGSWHFTPVLVREELLRRDE